MMPDKQNITAAITLAVKKLDFFSDALIKKKSTPLQETIHLAKDFLTKTFSERDNVREINSDVEEAILTIQKNFLYIQKLKKGTPEEKVIADASIQAVERYNAIIEKSSKKRNRIHHRIHQYIYKKLGTTPQLENDKNLIHLPFEATAQFSYSQNGKETDKISHTAISFMQGPECVVQENLLQEEADAFRMKVISLLKAQGFTPMGEEVRSAPIQALLHSDDLKKILMSQVVKPFPGEFFSFKGAFQRKSEAFFKSVPLFGSFEILTHSKQTGFPHPIQHTGWALADCMIPLCPLKPKLLKIFTPFFKLKHKTALELLPKGGLIAKAKELFKLKKQVFEENRAFFLAKHQELYQAMLGSKMEVPPFSHFSFSQLVDSQEAMIERFIVHPFEKLKEEFEVLQAEEEPHRYLAALSILESEQEKALKISSPFISCLGQFIGKMANAILLQHFSEVIGFSPLPLNENEKKLQAALYKQLLAFQKELREEWTKETLQHAIKAELESDILLFKAPFEDYVGPAKAIVDELAAYYS